MRTPHARTTLPRRAAAALLLAAAVVLAAGVPAAAAGPAPTAPGAGAAATLAGATTAEGFAAPVAVSVPVPTDPELVDFLTAVHGDLISTWGRLLEAWGVAASPHLVLFQSRETPVLVTACGPVRADVGPFYCGGDQSIYLALDFARDVWAYVGDMAVVQVVAHEFGHGVQQGLGLTPIEGSPSFELQADCLGGAYAQDADGRRLLEPGDVEEARELSRLVGDAGPSDDPHGTPDQREQAFDRGFGGGLDACLAV